MILIIDDEQHRMVATMDFLKELGYEISISDDIDLAVQFMAEHMTDVQAVILDIMMPWGNLFSIEQTEAGITTGVAFYNKLREEFGYRGPVIIYTALNRPALLNRLKKHANCAVVYKEGPSTGKIVEYLTQFGVLPSGKVEE